MDVNNFQAFYMEGQLADLKQGSADYRLVYVIAGELNIMFAGQNYHVVPGQVVITTLTNGDMICHPSADFACYLLLLDDSVVSGLVRRYLPYVKAVGSLAIVLATEKHSQSIQTLFTNIVEELQTATVSATTIVELRLQELFVRLSRSNSKILAGTYSNRDDIVSGVQALLEKKYYTSFALESLAAEYNVSVSYLAHIFKDITGMSVMRYLLLIRVREAQRYLQETSLPIKEIAEKCGFNDVSNFGRTFRKETGFAPRQYRQSHTMYGKPEDAE